MNMSMSDCVRPRCDPMAPKSAVVGSAGDETSCKSACSRSSGDPVLTRDSTQTTKKARFAGLLKPSDGLEPSTPLSVVRRRASPAWTPGQPGALAWCGCHLLSVAGGDCGAFGAPSLTWVHGPEGSGDKMIDRVWSPRGACSRPLCLSWPSTLEGAGGW